MITLKRSNDLYLDSIDFIEGTVFGAMVGSWLFRTVRIMAITVCHCGGAGNLRFNSQMDFILT